MSHVSFIADGKTFEDVKTEKIAVMLLEKGDQFFRHGMHYFVDDIIDGRVIYSTKASCGKGLLNQLSINSKERVLLICPPYVRTAHHYFDDIKIVFSPLNNNNDFTKSITEEG